MRWVLTNKKHVDEKGRNATKCKARLVALGYQDSQAEKNLFAATASASGHRIFLAVTASFQWKIGTIDVSTAFLQGKELERDVYAWPVPEMQVRPGCVIRLRKAVYGLAVAPLRWQLALIEAMQATGGRSTAVEPCLLVWRSKDPRDALNVDDGSVKKKGVENNANGEALAGIAVVHVDDTNFR